MGGRRRPRACPTEQPSRPTLASGPVWRVPRQSVDKKLVSLEGVTPPRQECLRYEIVRLTLWWPAGCERNRPFRGDLN